MEGNRLRAFQNRVLRSTDQRYFKGIFSPKRKDKGCTKPNNEEFHAFYFSPNIIKTNSDDDGLGYVQIKKIKLVQGFGEKPGRKETTYSTLKKSDRRGVDSGIAGKDAVLAYEEMNLRVTQNSRNLLIR
jgi:hypothetical protein